jgi:hypothetical protein
MNMKCLKVIADDPWLESLSEVILNSGFEVQLGGTFEINMNECGAK